MQNCRPSSFFLTSTTALHQALWLGKIVPDSSISCRWFWTSSTNGRGICLNHYLKGVSSITFIMCSIEWVQPNSAGSNENTLWYLARSWQAASASLGGQESTPLKSNSLNSLPCLCLTVNLGMWGPWGPSPPPSTRPPWVVWALVALQLPWPPGFSSGGSVSKPCCSLPPQLPFYFLASTPCMCCVQWGPVGAEPSSVHKVCTMMLMHSPV